MITFLLIVGLIISLGFNVATFIIIPRLLTRIDIYEDWILDLKTELINTVEEMRKIDRQGTFATSINDKGTFESDDQVGQIFKDILELIEKLNDKTQ
jgi:translation elongation factor EF-Tu-like GTPase